MQIFRSLAGYSYGRADVVRRAMSKKKHDVMERERSAFVDGCEKNGIQPVLANSIFDKMTDFASYAFNKSHAACYALVAYRCAYLKVYYPAEFMAALLSSVLDNSNKVARYIAECKRLGIRLAPPDINSSMKGFTASGNKLINYGLLGIKNLGNDFIEEIIKERENKPFSDLADFCTRMQSHRFNRRAAESLIRCGALDRLGANRKQMLQALPTLLGSIEQKYKSTMYGQVGLFDLGEGFEEEIKMPDVEEFSASELLQMEKEITGLYLSGHPMDKYDSYIEKSGCRRTYEILEAGASGSELKDGDRVTLCGIITHITVKQTRANKANMAFVTIEDLYGTVEIILFPNVFLKYASMITQNNVIAVSGALSVEEEKDAKILVNSVIKPTALGTASSSSTVKEAPKKKKRIGLFLKFNSRDDGKINFAMQRLSQSRGDFPVYFYYDDTKKYELRSDFEFVSMNRELVDSLKDLLGNDNVAVIEH